MSKVLYGTESPDLDARLEGALFKAPAPNGTETSNGESVTADANGVSKHYFTFSCADNTNPFIFNGIEICAKDSTFGDNISLETQYDAGEYGWKRYKKFGKTWYLTANCRTRIVLFPSEPQNGIRIEIEYTNKGQSAVEFYINHFQFVDWVKVDTGSLQEGSDW